MCKRNCQHDNMLDNTCTTITGFYRKFLKLWRHLGEACSCTQKPHKHTHKHTRARARFYNCSKMHTNVKQTQNPQNSNQQTHTHTHTIEWAIEEGASFVRGREWGNYRSGHSVSLSVAERSYIPAISMLKQYVTVHLPAGRAKEWTFQPLILLHPQTFNRATPSKPPP